MADTNKNSQDKSLGELFGELARETSTLVRQEVQLAKTEITQNISKVTKNIVFLVAGGLLGLGAFGAFVAALIFALANFVAPWLAALIVALVLGGIGGALLMKALGAMKGANLAPHHTIETIKEDVRWAKEQVN
jgi:hypothetical protein